MSDDPFRDQDERTRPDGSGNGSDPLGGDGKPPEADPTTEAEPPLELAPPPEAPPPEAPAPEPPALESKPDADVRPPVDAVEATPLPPLPPEPAQPEQRPDGDEALAATASDPATEVESWMERRAPAPDLSPTGAPPGDQLPAIATTLPERLRAVLDAGGGGDQSVLLALHAVVCAADQRGSATFHDVAIRYRDDYLAARRAIGKDAEHEAGRLGLDEVREHLGASVLPRLLTLGFVRIPGDGDLAHPEARLVVEPDLWAEIAPRRGTVESTLLQTGEHVGAVRAPSGEQAAVVPHGSLLEAQGLVKVYRRRKVVNDVALRLQQGEIVGLLGPNGAGKTTTFYMIVGLIEPQTGRIVLDGEDITRMPMYRRARRGIGYLSQEPSIFRKLSVEDNILSILETLDLSGSERKARLESLLDELGIKHLRHSKAFALSGGERRRLEITRALVTQPKFMMLDEPFAGVDPIAVHDIQSIVARLRHRGIGVLISDHNVEQTLDIVDRAYIMFDGQVKVAGTVRELVFDDTVAEIYLGPTLTARLRSRFAAEDSAS